MRDDARTGLQLTQQFRAKSFVQLFEQVKRDKCRVANVCVEQVRGDKAYLIRHSSGTCVFGGLLDENWIDFNTNTTGAVLLGGGYEDTSVTGSQVVDDVGALCLTQFQHGVDDLGRRWNIDDVGLPRRCLGLPLQESGPDGEGHPHNRSS